MRGWGAIWWNTEGETAVGVRAVGRWPDSEVSLGDINN